jgi:hypothetical protein
MILALETAASYGPKSELVLDEPVSKHGSEAADSRTCYHVLEELTAGTMHFKAAIITDGVDYGYFLYLASLDFESGNPFASEADTIIGAPPFGRADAVAEPIIGIQDGQGRNAITSSSSRQSSQSYHYVASVRQFTCSPVHPRRDDVIFLGSGSK